MEEEDFEGLKTDSEIAEESNVEKTEESTETNTEEVKDAKESKESQEENSLGKEGSEEVKEKDTDELPFGVRKRFNTLSKRARNAENRNIELTNRIQQLEEQIRKVLPKETKESIPLDEKSVNELVEKRLQEIELLKQERIAQETFEQNEEDARIRFDDYDDVASYASQNVTVSNECNLYLKQSKYGARILYTIGKFPKVMQAVNHAVQTEGLKSSLRMIKSIEERLIQIDSKMEEKSPIQPKEENVQQVQNNQPKQSGIRSPIRTNSAFKLKLDPSKCSDKEWMESDD